MMEPYSQHSKKAGQQKAPKEINSEGALEKLQSDLEGMLQKALKVEPAGEAEAYGNWALTHSVTGVGNRIRTVESHESVNYGVRVLSEQRLGFARLEEPGDAETALANAVKSASFEKKTSFSFPNKGERQEAGHFDSKIEDSGSADITAYAKEMLEHISKEVEPTEFGLEFTIISEALANSNGLQLGGRKAYSSAFLQLHNGETAAADDFILPYLDVGRFGTLAEQTSKTTLEMSKPLYSPKKIGIALFDHDAVEAYFGHLLMPSLVGERIGRGLSYMCGKLGANVASEKLTLAEIPRERLAGWAPFDGEGNECADGALIHKGILERYLMDEYTDAYYGMNSPTKGNCVRAATKPAIGTTNLEVAGGGCRNVLAEEKNVLLVKDYHGDHTANEMSGEFSVNLDVAYFWDGNELMPVRGKLLSGNTFNMLAHIKYIENAQKDCSFMRTPRIAFEGLTIV